MLQEDRCLIDSTSSCPCNECFHYSNLWPLKKKKLFALEIRGESNDTLLGVALELLYPRIHRPMLLPWRRLTPNHTDIRTLAKSPGDRGMFFFRALGNVRLNFVRGEVVSLGSDCVRNNYAST